MKKLILLLLLGALLASCGTGRRAELTRHKPGIYITDTNDTLTTSNRLLIDYIRAGGYFKIRVSKKNKIWDLREVKRKK